MAKEVFQRTKPHVNIGTIGHVDHGLVTEKEEAAVLNSGRQAWAPVTKKDLLRYSAKL